MKIEEVPFDISIVRGSVPVHGDATRSPGLHVSDIWESLNEQVDPMSEEQLREYGALGFVWEQVIDAGIAAACANNRYIRIGELELDGIAGSPDLIDTEEWAVVDTKCTWRGSKRLEDFEGSFWKWAVQAKAYCHMLGVTSGRPCTTAYIWAIFICGTWKPPRPQWKVVRLTFSPVELVDNWAMLVNHAKDQGWL